VTLLPYKMG